jgi:peptidoglycan/xylan/chitin deacetylase (PgdA/CDA1 family)
MKAPWTPPNGFAARFERRRIARTAARPATLRLAKPTVSFTFDGFPRSAARTGAALVAHVGGRATFYASAAFAGEATVAGPMFAAEDVVALQSDGHEIGCRTFSSLDCARTSVDAVFDDMVRNADALARLGMESRLETFAYPFGETSLALKAQLPSRFAGARGMAAGLASGRSDLAQLRANAMYGRGALNRCLAVLDAARRRSGWVIFHAQDVGPRPGPFGVPTGLLERLCGAAYAGGMRILPVRAALAAAAAEHADE